MNKNTPKAIIFSILCSTLCTVLISTKLFAANQEKISIAITSDAQIFAKFDDEIPAVINYFTNKSESNIVTFYEEKYGPAILSDKKRGRLEKLFKMDDKKIQVIISEQNNKRQVDVLVTK